MKKIILFIFVSLIISIVPTCVHADAYTKYPSPNAVLINGEDKYTLEYKEPYNVFRINKNNVAFSEFEVNGYTLNKVKMKVINDNLYLFGCVQVKINDDWNFYYVPVLYKFSLTPELLKSYECTYVDKSGELYSFISSVETIGKYSYISLGFNLQRNTVNYYGNYKIIKLDENLEEVDSFSLTSDEVELNKIYDCLVVSRSTNNIYLNKDLEVKESYSEEDTYLGSYILESDTIVNGIEKVKSTPLSIPGEYTLKEKEFAEKIVHIDPIIEIKESDNKITYKVSGGDVYINGKISPLTGEVTDVGEYTLEVKGLGVYRVTKNFSIKPKIEFTPKEKYEIGDVLEFIGDAYLNDEKIESGFVIEEAGSYLLEFKYQDETIESYTFIVEEELITKDDKRIMYIALSIMIVLSIAILVILLLVDIIKRRKAKKELYN